MKSKSKMFCSIIHTEGAQRQKEYFWYRLIVAVFNLHIIWVLQGMYHARNRKMYNDIVFIVSCNITLKT